LELCLACAIGKASIPHDLDENPSYLARFLTIRGETGGYFIVRDHNRQPLAYLSFEDEPGGAAQGIAANIAELPALLTQTGERKTRGRPPPRPSMHLLIPPVLA
jgi:hypothetical protein